MMSLWHAEFHCEDKNILEPYHLHNKIFFTKKTVYTGKCPRIIISQEKKMMQYKL